MDKLDKAPAARGTETIKYFDNNAHKVKLSTTKMKKEGDWIVG
jgi:hypothetical protein